MENSTDTTSTRVQYREKEYNVIKEGLAHILNPPSQEAASKATKKDLKADDESQAVFYNPIQQFNRDLSVLAIRAFGEHAMQLKEKKEAQKLKKRKTDDSADNAKKRKREEDAAAEEPASKRVDEETKVKSEDDSVEQPGAPAEVKQEKEAPSGTSSRPQFTVLDALSATGLRALRYASELPMVSKVVANDLSASAINSMKTNIDYNKLESLIQPNLGDARAYMYQLPSVDKFDVIDLDPYGTAAPFLDAAVQSVKDGGLLCVTCTDASIWASTGYAEKSFSLYGGMPMKGPHSHEGGLRLILNSLAMSAAKYGLSVEPLLSLSIDFYARVFVRVYRSPAQVKFLGANSMVVYNCDSGCGAWSTQPLASLKTKLNRKGNALYHHGLAQAPVSNTNCEHCGFKTHLAGPMWAGPLHNPAFIQRILANLPKLDPTVYQTIPRIEGMLTTALEEDLDLTLCASSSAQTEVATETNDLSAEYPAIIPRMDPARRDPYPFFMLLGSLSKVLHCSTAPIDEFRGALHSIGYRSTRSHAKPNSVRTDAPWSVVWEVMREWIRQESPIKDGSLKPGSAGAAIMAKSRDNLRKLDEESQWLSMLKRDIMSAVESGRDVSDLVTKVEASIYRSGSRQAWKSSEETSQTVASAESEAEPLSASEKETGATKTSEHAHPSSLEVKFDSALGREASAAHSKKRLVRYQINPRANWGPLNRASVTK
ncbi:tRNA (guanine(26)-N(2))-dimethyltransferase [Penicillium verhagenii]|uniref:tRNA (guanine(26)-N(2))-dimethyltransferase n=1 Tax=Penicillium verhagenii TaxID=1562060 RepID=UPI0025458319|nr:tRNA (guanine(26)-N(2))-dimethyltransferase [Penicillium verhagenii]KAJ5930774.1 tRNA (guanine(26)-N(2))-dimethyltransferase [Penicillium verhagenii]